MKVFSPSVPEHRARDITQLHLILLYIRKKYYFIQECRQWHFLPLQSLQWPRATGQWMHTKDQTGIGKLALCYLPWGLWNPTKGPAFYQVFTPQCTTFYHRLSQHSPGYHSSAPVTTGSAQLQLPLAQHSPAYHRLSTAWATTDPTQPCLPQAQNSLDYHSPAQPQLPQAQHSLGYHRQSELQEELQKSDSLTFQKPGFVLWFTTSKTSLCFTFNRIYCPTYLM